MAEQPTNSETPERRDTGERLPIGLDALVSDNEEPETEFDAESDATRPNFVLRLALPFFRILFPDLDEVRPDRPVPAAPVASTGTLDSPAVVGGLPASTVMTDETLTPDSTITVVRWNFKLLAWGILLSAIAGFGVRALHGRQVSGLAVAMRDEAETARKSGDDERQEKFLSRYVALSPDDTAATAELALLLERTAESRGDYLRAYRLLRKVCRHAETPHETRRRLVRLAIGLGRYRDALGQLEMLRHRFPRDAELSLLAGHTLEQQGEYTDAAAAYARAIEIDPRQLDAYVPLANLLDRRLNRTSQSVELLDQLVNANPQSQRAFLSRATFRLRWGEYRTAADDVQVARLVGANDLALDLLESRLVVALGDDAAWSLTETTAKLESRLADRGDDVRLYAALSDLSHAGGRLDEAEIWLHRGLEQLPTDFGLRVQLIASLIDRNEIALAEKQLSRLGESSADASQVRLANRCFRGYMALQSANWLDAAALLEEARPRLDSIPLLQRSADVWLAAAYRSMRNREMELAAYRRALESHPASIDARRGLASSLAAKGRYDDAIAHLRIVGDVKGVPLEIARLLIRKNLSLSIAQRDWPGVARAIDAAERSGSDAVEVLLLRARQQELEERPDRARGILRAATKNEPGKVRFWAALAGLEQRQRGNAAALEILDTVEGIHPSRVELWLVRIDCVQPAKLVEIEGELDQFASEEQVPLLRRLACAYQKTEQLEAASRLFSRAAQLRPGNMELLLLAFEASLNAGGTDVCEKFLEQIAQIEGESGPHVRSGRIAMLIARVECGQSTDISRAVTMLAALKREHPRWQYSTLLEARVNELEGKSSQAARNYREALEEGTANPNALLRLVRYHSEQQDFVTADALLRTYGMQLDLRASSALLDVASEIATRTGDSPRALDLALRWTVIDPDNYRAHLRLGRYLSHSTKDGRAVEAFKKSLDAAESAMARFHLAWAYRRLDNRRQAAEEFRRAKELGVREESLDEAERPKFRKLAEWLKRN